MEEVILKKEVRKLGDRGEIVRVAPGYARNFLYPQNLAMPATAANKKQIQEMQAAGAREAARLHGDAQKLAGLMSDVTVRHVARAGDRGQLFGSVTVRDIAELLQAQGFPIDRHKIILGSPLKETGDYEVRVHLYRDVDVMVKVEVRAEGREDELFGEAAEAARAAEEAERAAKEEAAAAAKLAAQATETEEDKPAVGEDEEEAVDKEV